MRAMTSLRQLQLRSGDVLPAVRMPRGSGVGIDRGEVVQGRMVNIG